MNVLKTEPVQFPLDEILNEDERMVRGWMTAQIKDKQGEIIPISDTVRSLNTWMKRGGFIIDSHTNRVVGKATRWFEAEHPVAKVPGIIIDYQIYKDYSIDDEVWDEIKKKKRGLSYGGRALEKPTEKVIKTPQGTDTARELHGLETYEVSSVKSPANLLSENIAINFLAKSNVEKDRIVFKGYEPVQCPYCRRWSTEHQHTPWRGKCEFCGEEFVTDSEGLSYQLEEKKLIPDLAKGFDYIDVTKPFAGFKDFQTCVDSQKKRGHSEDSAKRICGWLQARTEGEKMDELKIQEVTKPADKRPPKRWWDRIYSALSRKRGVQDPARLAGWVFYHHMKTKGISDPEPTLTEEMLKAEGDDRITATARRRKRSWLRAQKEDWDWSDDEIDDEIDDAMEEWDGYGPEEEDEEKSKPLKVEENKNIIGGIKMEDKKTTEPIKQEASLTDVIAKLDQILSIVSQKSTPIVEPIKQSPEGGTVKLPTATAEEIYEKPKKPITDEVTVSVKQEEEKPEEIKPKDKLKPETEKSEILKSMGVKVEGKATRPATDIVKTQESISIDPNLALLEKVKEGKMSQADLNREVKKMVHDARNEALRRILG